MTIHAVYDIRKGRLSLSVDGTERITTTCSVEVLSALDALEVPYVYEEIGHTSLYQTNMEWRNEPCNRAKADEQEGEE